MRIGSASETAVNVRDGYSSFVITLYKRSLTAIETTGINKLFFTFKNNSLSSGVDGKTLEECLNGWSRTVPNGKNPLYCTSATAFGNKDIDDIQPNEWTTPTVMSENGTKGENGLTTTTVLLYKRSDEIPETPQSEITYDFYSGEVIGSLSGWSTTLPDFNGKALWGTNATVSAILGENVQTGTITKEKWSIPKKIVTDGKDGKSPVESYIDTYTFLLVADQYGIISSKEYTTINAKVVLMQRGEKLTCVAYGSSLENGNFYITRAENGITNTEIELDTIKGTTDSVMLKDSASVILTITYKDLDGELGSLIKTVYIKKVYTPKEAEPMLFAWSSSEDVFTPKDTNRVWMYSDKYVQFDSKLIGDFALYNFVEWDEVIKAKSDDYPYLWCKYTPNGTPILFSGRDGKNGLNGQYTAFQYYASTSDTTQQGGVWSDTVPSIAGGKYLWMRTQVVPAGGSISSSAWGTPVLAGTDISKLMTTIETTNSQVVELGDKVTQNTTAINANSSAIATKVNQTVYDDKISSIESTIEQTASKIALTVETVNGEKVVKYNGIVISEKDGEGNILIRADKILLDGSVTADKIDVEDLMSKKFKIKDGGVISSSEISPNPSEDVDEEGFLLSAGFRLEGDNGIIRAKNAFLSSVYIDLLSKIYGEIVSDALRTYNGQNTTKTYTSNTTKNTKYWKYQEVIDAMTNSNVITDTTGSYAGNTVSKYAKVTDKNYLYEKENFLYHTGINSSGSAGAAAYNSAVTGYNNSFGTPDSSTYTYYDNVDNNYDNLTRTFTNTSNIKKTLLIKWYGAEWPYSSAAPFLGYIRYTLNSPGSSQELKTNAGANQTTIDVESGHRISFDFEGYIACTIQVVGSPLISAGITSLGLWLYYNSTWNKISETAYQSTSLSLLGVSNQYIRWESNCYASGESSPTLSGGFTNLSNSSSVVADGTTYVPETVSWNSNSISFSNSSGEVVVISKTSFFKTFSFNFSVQSSSSRIESAKILPKDTAVTIGEMDTPWSTIYSKQVFAYENGQWIKLGKGEKGDKGDKGDKGATGPQGPQGPTGGAVFN